MRKFMLWTALVVALFAFHSRGEELKDLVGSAALAGGEEYKTIRNRIVQEGRVVMPVLQELAENKSQDWKSRLIAAICKERIEREAEIRSLENKNWKSDPDFHRDMTASLAGPVAKMRPLIAKRLSEAALWRYYLEYVWKKTGDLTVMGDQIYAVVWNVLRDSPVKDDFFLILEDRIENDLTLKTTPGSGAFAYLTEHGTRHSLPVLLKSWKAQGTIHDEWIFKIISLAEPDDFDLLEAFMQDPETKFSRSELMCREHLKKLRVARDKKREEERQTKDEIENP